MKPGDDLDGLLRTFFRSQMPQPWPASPARHAKNLSPARPTSSRHPLMRSRFALAASVALLLLGSLFLPARFTNELKPGSETPGSLYGRDVLRERMRQEMKDKQLEKDHKPGFGIDDGEDFELPSMK